MKLKRKRSKLNVLARQFLSERFSAAGVSYLMDQRSQRSRLRRFLWLVGLLLCCSIMGYMSVRVFMEYLKYPKSLSIEDIIVPRLHFPAVTVCPLNPVVTKFVANTSFGRLVKLRQFLDEARIDSPDIEKNACYKDPLCTWSWFEDTCSCLPNPCSTEFCVSKNKTHCYCSADICDIHLVSCKPVTGVPFSFSNDTCECSKDDRHLSPLASNVTTDVQKLLSKVKDMDVRRVLEILLRSNVSDISDVDEILMPSMAEMYEYSISFESLVPSCSFENGPCFRENFTLLYHPKYGKCYMFNYVGGYLASHKQPIMTHSYGSSSGLRLMLRVTDSETLDLVRRDVGARVVVHDPYKLPLLTEYGVNIRPLDMTALGVMLTNVSRLGQPWGNCLSKTSDHRVPYSVLACEKQCQLDKIILECQCALRKLLTGSTLSPKKTEYNVCGISHSACVRSVISQFEDRNMDCGCRPPCQENTYSFMVTSSKLNDKYFKTVKAVRTLDVGPDGSFSHTAISDTKSLLGVKVYYRSFQVTQQIEVASYSWETFVANLCGNLGFFMGLTLVTTLEVIEFAIDIILAAFCKEHRKKGHGNRASNTISLYSNYFSKGMGSDCLSPRKIYSARRCKTRREKNAHMLFNRTSALNY